jgi:hypothetical protein
MDDEQSRAVTEEDNVRYKEMDIVPIRYPAPGGDHSVLWSALEQLGNLSKIAPNHGWEEGGTYAT